MANKNYSSWSVRPWFFLQHAGIPFRERLIALQQPGYEAEIKRWSPSGRVPVLRLDDGDVVWDTLAIGECLAELYPDSGVWPSEARARRRARSAAAEMHSGFFELRRVCTCNARTRYAPDAWRQVAGGAAAEAAVLAEVARVEELWTGLLEASGGPFLCGAFGYVDAYFVPVVSRLDTYGFVSGDAAARYRAAVQGSSTYATWLDQARAETLTIARYEYDLPRN